MHPAQRPSDEHLSAWLDHALGPAEHQAVAAWLHDHPEDAALTRLWAADRDALRARLDPVLDEPLPAALRLALQPQNPARLAANQPNWRRAAWAAGLLLGGGLLGGLIGAAAVSHDPAFLAAADRVLVMQGGRVVADGSLEEVFRTPAAGAILGAVGVTP